MSGVGVRLRAAVPALLIFVTVLVAWEVLVRALGIKGFILPAPSVVAAVFGSEQAAGLWRAGIATFSGALAGLAVGFVAAALAAVAAARWIAVRPGAMPLAVAANSMPIIVLAPVANAWFGLTNPVGTIVVVATLVFFPLMINMVKGLQSAAASHHELLASYAATRRTVLLRLQVPAALPFVFSALKVAAPLALIGAIVKEYFGGPQERLGQFITRAAGLLQLDQAWAAIVLASAFGILLYSLVVLVERHAIAWHASVRGRPT